MDEMFLVFLLQVQVFPQLSRRDHHNRDTALMDTADEVAQEQEELGHLPGSSCPVSSSVVVIDRKKATRGWAHTFQDRLSQGIDRIGL